MLRPGGLAIVIEPDLTPVADGKSARQFPHGSGLQGWFTLWETYRACLQGQGVDITVPQRLAELLAATGGFQSIVKQDGNIPVGFWPKGADALFRRNRARSYWIECRSSYAHRWAATVDGL